jgi:hypothetical protein
MNRTTQSRWRLRFEDEPTLKEQLERVQAADSRLDSAVGKGQSIKFKLRYIQGAPAQGWVPISSHCQLSLLLLVIDSMMKFGELSGGALNLLKLEFYRLPRSRLRYPP